jgi:hypothetical protein
LVITPELAFDCAHEAYKSIRADQEGIPLIDPAKIPSQHLWHPDSSPRSAEYVADFSIACMFALRFEKNLWKLCEIYYLALTPYDRARKQVGIREDTFADWMDEIRRQVGSETQRRGLFPVRNYFGDRAKPHRTGLIRGKIPTAHSASHI